MHRTIPFGMGLLAILGACHPRPPEPLPEQDPGAFVLLRDRLDVDRHAGRVVVVQGVFDHDRGIHGLLRLDTGLTLLLPDFHRHPAVRGVPWTQWVGWRMWVVGRLHSRATEVEDWDGPALYVYRFGPPRP